MQSSADPEGVNIQLEGESTAVRSCSETGDVENSAGRSSLDTAALEGDIWTAEYLIWIVLKRMIVYTNVSTEVFYSVLTSIRFVNHRKWLSDTESEWRKWIQIQQPIRN